MGFGWGEILLIVFIILILFGANRIPELAKSFGKGVREFKKGLNDISDDVRREEPKKDEPLKKD